MHPCIYCDNDCDCSGSIDDAVVDKTPKNCKGCGCKEFAKDQGWDVGDEDYDPDGDWDDMDDDTDNFNDEPEN